MRFMLSLAAAALLAAILAPGASAAQARPTRAAIVLGGTNDPFWGRRGDFICRRWCTEDRNPCDPVQYKVADGRCFGEVRTFFGVLNCRIGNDPRPECPH